MNAPYIQPFGAGQRSRSVRWNDSSLDALSLSKCAFFGTSEDTVKEAEMIVRDVPLHVPEMTPIVMIEQQRCGAMLRGCAEAHL